MKEFKIKQYLAIEEILITEDPVKLIKIGAPLDEYSSEAALIFYQISKIDKTYSVKKIHNIIYDIFLECFGSEEIIGKFDDYKEIAVKIENVFNG